MTGQLPRGPAVIDSAVGPLGPVESVGSIGSGLASGAVEAWWRTRTGYPYRYRWLLATGGLQQTMSGNAPHYGGSN